MRIAKRRVAHPKLARSTSSSANGSAILRAAQLVGGRGGLDRRNGWHGIRIRARSQGIGVATWRQKSNARRDHSGWRGDFDAVGARGKLGMDL